MGQPILDELHLLKTSPPDYLPDRLHHCDIIIMCPTLSDGEGHLALDQLSTFPQKQFEEIKENIFTGVYLWRLNCAFVFNMWGRKIMFKK